MCDNNLCSRSILLYIQMKAQVSLDEFSPQEMYDVYNTVQGWVLLILCGFEETVRAKLMCGQISVHHIPFWNTL